MIQVLTYQAVQNLGDAVQAIAITRLLGSTQGVNREQCDLADPEKLFLLNGWLGSDPPGTTTNTLFAGVFVDKPKYFPWIKSSRFPVGARDPSTCSMMAKAGIRAEIIGCASLTFPRYSGPRHGTLRIDAPGDGEIFTHLLDAPWETQWKRATEMLNRYRTASLVFTSRLHVALPCLAFGTPVIVSDPINLPGDSVDRFSLLDMLGVRYRQECVLDVSWLTARYLSFVERHAGAFAYTDAVLPVSKNSS